MLVTKPTSGIRDVRGERMWKPKKRTHNLETKGVCGGREVGEVGNDRGFFGLEVVP